MAYLTGVFCGEAAVVYLVVRAMLGDGCGAATTTVLVSMSTLLLFVWAPQMPAAHDKQHRHTLAQ